MPVSRLVLLLTALLLPLATKAWAGDVSRVEVLGFSADGGIFAFEEYGVQDGSGFPYSSRYYIDTEEDRFVSGTPVDVVLREGNATLAEARAEAASRAQHIIGDDVLAAHSGYRAGWNAITEESADFTRMRVNPRPIYPPVDKPLEFRLEEVGVEQPERCAGLGRVVGFRLLRVGAEAGETTRVVHEDSRVPGSRGCPTEYRLGGIHTYFPDGGTPAFAVMIAVKSFGFEGPAFDWIAVTGRP